MRTHYHIGQVLISFALSFISAYNAVCFADIYHLSATFPPKYFSSTIQLLFMSIAIGGGAVWSMHFTGMAALVLVSKDGQRIPLHYNLGTTIFSLFAAIICVYFGLLISTRDRVFAKDREELFQMFVEDVNSNGVNTQDRARLFRLTFLKGINHICIGGFITGGGICVMHYIGMMAQHAHESILIHWKVELVAFSVVIAIVASISAFWILFRLLPLFPNWESLRITSSVIMATAVCGMHYTGMDAACYHENSSHESKDIYVGESFMNTHDAGLAAIVSSLIVNWIFSMVIQSELRHSSQTRSHELDKAKNELKVLYEKYPEDIPREPKYSSHYSSEGNQSSLPSQQNSVNFAFTVEFSNLWKKFSQSGAPIAPTCSSRPLPLASKGPKLKNNDLDIESNCKDPFAQE